MSIISRIFVTVSFFILFTNGCKKDDSAAGAEDAGKLVRAIAQQLYEGESALLKESCDWDSMYDNFAKRGEIARPTSKDELFSQFLRAALLMFTPGNAERSAVFNTKVFCSSADRCDVFLFDGDEERSGAINLTFMLERNSKIWKIIDTNFYAYARWAVTSNASLRKTFRQKMLSQFR
ncbi:MAG: hypothetical protein Kow0090_21540 [Myxococcota bacterium]